MKPLPFEAYEKALKFIYWRTCDVLDLWGEDFKKIGVCDNFEDSPFELLVEMTDESCLILYEDMQNKMKNFWELRLEGEDGYYITYKIGNTKYTAFYGKGIVDLWELKFLAGFSMYDPNLVKL